MSAIFTITFECGHVQDRDLSEKPFEDRQKFAAWLQGQECGDCFYEKNKSRLQSSRIRAWKAEQDQAAAEDIEQQQLPALNGTEKQVGWANRVRRQKMQLAYEELVEPGTLTDAEFETQFVEPVRLITSASWWIDNREADPATIPDLIEEARAAGNPSVSENPF